MPQGHTCRDIPTVTEAKQRSKPGRGIGQTLLLFHRVISMSDSQLRLDETWSPWQTGSVADTTQNLRFGHYWKSWYMYAINVKQGRNLIVIYQYTARLMECEFSSSPLDKVAAISQQIFSDAFSWMKSFVFWLKFHWSLFLMVQLTITQHWFR